jgi:WD40 repeat protein
VQPQITTSDRPAGTLDAFVSYARADTEAVLPLVRAASARGGTFWLDADDIPPGAPWRTELGTALEAANAVVCCLSTAWLRSVECRREYDRALDLGKRLVPVLVEAVGEAPAALRSLQWIDARRPADPDVVADSIMQAVNADFERVREHTHWLSRALRWEAKRFDPSLLLRGRDLRAAEEWLARPPGDPAPTALQTRLVVLSRQAERRRLRRTIGASLTAVVVSLALAAVALISRNEAVRQKQQADSRALAAAAVSQLDVDPEVSLLLARQAWTVAPTAQAVSALRVSIQRSQVRLTVAAHADPTASVSGVSWSPDGRTIMSAGRDGVITAWDAGAGAERGRLTLGTGSVESFSAARSTPAGVAVTKDGRAVLWWLAPATNRLTLRAELAATGVADATITPDGRTVAAGMQDGTIRLWTGQGRPLRTLDWGLGSSIRSLAIAGNGRGIAVGTAGGAAVAGSVTGSRGIRVDRYRYAVTTVQMSADGSEVLTAAMDGTGSVRRSRDGKLLMTVPRVFYAAMDPAGRRVAVGDVDGHLRLLTIGAEPVSLGGSGAPATDIAFSADGSLLLQSTLDGAGKVWRMPTGQPVTEVRGRSDSMTRLALSPDDKRLLTGHADGRLHVWAMPDQPSPIQLFTPAEVAQFGSAADTTVVDFSPDGRTLLTASRDGRARVWNPGDKRELLGGSHCAGGPMGPRCLASMTFMAHGTYLTRARYSPDGRRIATSSVNGTVVLWDAATMDVVSRPSGPGVRVDDLAFSPDGRLLALASDDGRTRLVDTGTGRPVVDLTKSGSGIIRTEFTPDGTGLVTSAEDGTVLLWDVRHRTARLMIDTPTSALALAVDPRGRFLAVGDNDLVVQLALPDGKRVRTMAGHVGFVTDLAFAPGGDLLMSGGLDGAVRVWDLNSGDQADLFRTPRGYVTALDVDPTGRTVAAATTGGAAYLFTCVVCGGGNELARLAAERSTRTLTADERSRFVVEGGG